MNVVYAMQPLVRSIFLAGPTPRSDDVPSWRPEALQYLEEFGFNGTVYVPESEDWKQRSNYDGQVHWELCALVKADCIAFWVPRDIETMPAFTTNVEFGYHIASHRVVYGRPEGAPKTQYLDILAEKHGVYPKDDLRELMREAIYMAQK